MKMPLQSFSPGTAIAAWSGLMVGFLIVFSPASLPQPSPIDPFVQRYQWLIATPDSIDKHEIDSAFNLLLEMHLDQPGKHDSLIPSLLTWYFMRTSGSLTPEEKRQQLLSFQPVIDGLRQTSPVDAARYLSLSIPLFWTHYQIDSIARYLDRMDEYLQMDPGPTDLRIIWCYEKGRLAMTQGDYEAGLTFFRQGLQYLSIHFPDLVRMKINLLNAIGIAYRRTGQTEAAILHFESILREHHDDIRAVDMTGTILNNLGLANKDMGRWETAIRYIARAVNDYARFRSPTFSDIGSGYDNIAICYQAWGRLDSALVYSRKSLEFIEQNLGMQHPDLLLPMCSIISTLVQQDKPEEALVVFDRAVSLLQDLGWTANDPSGDYFLADAFDVFAYGAAIFRALYDRSLDTTYLIRAIEAGDHFMGLTDYAYDHLRQDLSKDIFQRRHAADFSLCIDNLFTQYQRNRDPLSIRKAFLYGEKFKSLELLYAAQKDKADQIDRYKTYNEQYQFYQDSIRWYEQEAGPDSAGLAPSPHLVRLRQEFYLWKEQIQKEDPEYYQLIYHPEPFPIEELQKKLVPGQQSMLSYHLADDAVYTFLIRSDTFMFFRQETSSDMPERIAAFRSSIRDFITPVTRTDSGYVGAADRYCAESHQLYSVLIRPVQPWLTSRVIIVVDKALGYLPFDLLLKEKPVTSHHFRDHAYLLRDHALSYSYSARLWLDMQEKKNRPGHRLLAIAPAFGKQDPNTPRPGDPSSFRPASLQYNQAEVGAVKAIWPGRSLTGMHATASRFRREAPTFQLIHLATHGHAHDEEGDFSYLVFADTSAAGSRLLANDIYQMHLRADMVTLSACETGLGPLRSGEGLISLARAFAFAGARSIVSSLWAVHDESTLRVMTTFYRQLRHRVPKDIAMQRAKLDYLDQSGHTDAHPFLWGAFICVGDMDPIEAHGASLWILIIPVAFVIFIFIFLKKIRPWLGTLH